MPNPLLSLRHLLDLTETDPALQKQLSSAASTAEWTTQLLARAGRNNVEITETDLSDLIAIESAPGRMRLPDTALDAVSAGFLPVPTIDERYEKMKKDILDAGGTITFCDPVSRRILFTPQEGEPTGPM